MAGIFRYFVDKFKVLYNLFMAKRLIIFGFAIVAVFLGIFFFSVFQKGQNAGETAEKESIFKSRQLETIAGYKAGQLRENGPSLFSGAANWNIGIPKEPEFKPLFEQEKDNLAEDFLRRFEELSKISVPLIPSASDKITINPSAVQAENKEEITDSLIATSTPDEIILSLTDEEFRYLYPDYFLDSLLKAQEVLIESYIPSYKAVAKIKTDAQVRFIEEKIVESFLSAGMITKEKVDRAIKTIRFTLPQLQIAELKSRKAVSANKLMPAYISIIGKEYSVKTDSRGFLSDILKKTELLNLFVSKNPFPFMLAQKINNIFFSEAKAAPCGACMDLPECFKVGASNPAVGINIFKLACLCTGCYSGLGCLDFCTGQSAIWDPTTNICGCG